MTKPKLNHKKNNIFKRVKNTLYLNFQLLIIFYVNKIQKN